MEEGDKEFLYSTWLNSYRFYSSFTSRMRTSHFYEWHEKVINRLIGRGAVARFAVLKADPFVILGYMVHEDQHPKIIHFCYVKKDFRGNGIAKSLMQDAGVNLENVNYYTHYTEISDRLVKEEKYKNLCYIPYLI